ncbi:ribonuclease H-like [Larus michahellis]|uniref:ribonuclease H-like n=1 Tax=Larus michahellis TaxID=119627 RepID=UPI003D9BD869
MDWPEGKDFGMSPEEEVTRAEEAPPYNKLPENGKKYALFTDGSCQIVGKHRKWKAAVWSPTRQVAEASEGQGESSQFAEVKAIQLALDIAEQEKWPVLYLYTDSWMVANALWGWLQHWKQDNWQCRGKPSALRAGELWQYIAARIENLVVKLHHVDAHVPKNRATEEHQNNQQIDQAVKIKVGHLLFFDPQQPHNRRVLRETRQEMTWKFLQEDQKQDQAFCSVWGTARWKLGRHFSWRDPLLWSFFLATPVPVSAGSK